MVLLHNNSIKDYITLHYITLHYIAAGAISVLLHNGRLNLHETKALI